MKIYSDGTYEAIGKHFNGNPYGFAKCDMLIKHGQDIIPNSELERSFEGIKRYLNENYIEGIVFWKDGEPQCKIKRTDFGFDWGMGYMLKNNWKKFSKIPVNEQ